MSPYSHLTSLPHFSYTVKLVYYTIWVLDCTTQLFAYERWYLYHMWIISFFFYFYYFLFPAIQVSDLANGCWTLLYIFFFDLTFPIKIVKFIFLLKTPTCLFNKRQNQVTTPLKIITCIVLLFIPKDMTFLN